MKTCQPKSTAIRVLALVGLTITIGAGAGAANEETVYGHKIPPFKTVFIKVFRSFLQLSSMDQLRTTSTLLTDRERASISYFLGADGHNQVKEGLPKEKQDFLQQKYAIHTQVPYEADFHKVYPHILATSGNGLTLEQWKTFLDGLSVEELASQNFWLAGDGRTVVVEEIQEAPVRPDDLHSGDADLVSPMPGSVVAVGVVHGERVEAGATVVAVEAMKMEHALRAPVAGVVELLVAVGDQVGRGQPLARIVNTESAIP